jgi:type II secretory pathway component GspD/PulD (secretin)
MNPTQLIRSALLAFLTLFGLAAAGQNALEIIPLRHRTAEQVLGTLRPLAEPGAVLSGQGSQLFVRTSPANLAEIRRALDSLDRPLRRLQISVRFAEALDAATQSVEANGRISNRGARVDVRAQDSSTSGGERVDQRIQVLEGGRAYIVAGQSTPFPPGAFLDTATGFEAVPRLVGETVVLEIAPRRETPGQHQSLVTTVSGRLGEWFEIGSTVNQASRSVWLKVDELGQ